MGWGGGGGTISTGVSVRTPTLLAVARAAVMIPTPHPERPKCPHAGERSEETRLSALTLQKQCEWMCADRRKVASLAEQPEDATAPAAPAPQEG